MCECADVRVFLFVNACMFVCLMHLCANVLMCSTKLFAALSPSKFYLFLGRKRSEITAFFKTSKQIFL